MKTLLELLGFYHPTPLERVADMNRWLGRHAYGFKNYQEAAKWLRSHGAFMLGRCGLSKGEHPGTHDGGVSARVWYDTTTPPGMEIRVRVVGPPYELMAYLVGG